MASSLKILSRGPCLVVSQGLAIVLLLWSHHALAASLSAADYQRAAAASGRVLAAPAYAALADQTQALATTLTQWRAGKVDLVAARSAFHAAMDAWQGTQPIRIGPVMAQTGPARWQYWPDKHGSGGRQMRRALKTRPEALLKPGALATQSVALRDFQALERLLFPTGGAAPDPASYGAALAAAIAAHLAEQSQSLRMQWDDQFQPALDDPAHSNGAFYDAPDAARAWLKSIHEAISLLILQKLERPLDESLEAANPKRAENWRSARSGRNVAINVAAWRRLFTAPDGLGDLLSRSGSDALAKGMARDMASAQKAAESLSMPLSQAVADAEARSQVEALLTQLKDLRDLIEGPLADEIGLNLGFNALDGD
ncbi:imelysin family protein [Magnetofaba australis]|uniref:Imelysin-like domain-containing protein n=1 Tax=Magnetofaba australis IT-1 TaxID=1434232 RepID=A0A1Y2K9I1_9PROT|nr:imelysin family protein [Magnetofaba australis]OSM07136.1 hypothetical protein MAIT1_03950 [Magnetofaba australis IT-1]